MSREVSCDILVVGSGPGGAMTAATLARAGRNVLLVEEGQHLLVGSAPAHSAEEMSQKWRYGGLSTTLGTTKVTCIEGRCVGGASETNAGLYHAPPPDTLQMWAQRYAIRDFGADALAPHTESMLADVPVTRHPAGLSTISKRIEQGANELGWKSAELPRFWAYAQQPDGVWKGVRQSMTQTLVPQAVAAGCTLLSSTRIQRLEAKGRQFIAAHGTSEGEAIQIRFNSVFVCAGALQSALLLQRSGVTHHVGNSLTLNPMIRVLARFADPINEPGRGVPVQQVEAFKPAMTLGCSHSDIQHLALWMGGDPVSKQRLLSQWRHLAILYVKVMPQGFGRVRSLPVVDQPLIRFPIEQGDFQQLSLGLGRLGQLAFAAGAVEICHPIAGAPSVQRGQDPALLGQGIGPGAVSLSAIHLHSTCPMGESPSSATDSYGRVRETEGLLVNDSSLLPASPGINPQGLILAIARRNAVAFLEGR
jgi:choline dehydrogenase-like flavoprotein